MKKMAKQVFAFLMAVLMVPVFYVLPAEALINEKSCNKNWAAGV